MHFNGISIHMYGCLWFGHWNLPHNTAAVSSWISACFVSKIMSLCFHSCHSIEVLQSEGNLLFHALQHVRNPYARNVRDTSVLSCIVVESMTKIDMTTWKQMPVWNSTNETPSCILEWHLAGRCRWWQLSQLQFLAQHICIHFSTGLVFSSFFFVMKHVKSSCSIMNR